MTKVTNCATFLVEETRHMMRIPKRVVTYIVLSVNLLMLIHR